MLSGDTLMMKLDDNTVSLITKLNEYDFDKLNNDVSRIIELYPTLPQIGLTHTIAQLSETEKIIECTGSLYDYDTKTFRYKETDFTEFNSAFKDTYIYEMYKSLPDIGRVRIMVMDGPKCYSIHRDLTTRFHYVLETNKDCFFIFPELGRQEHIPCDHSLYMIDTRHRHTFVNGSKKRRVHLVLDDLSTLR